MSLYLVTGGAGFIGSNIVEKLVSQGKQVRVIDNLSTGNIANLSGVMSDIDFVQADITDFEAVKRVMDGADYVIHQAALPSVPRSIADPVSSNNANIVGTVNLLTAAKDSGVKRFVYAASSSAYGDSLIFPRVETIPPSPLSPYAVSKYTGELYCKVFYDIYGLETVSLRYFNIFGPKQNPNSEYAAVIPKFITLLLNNEKPVIYGDGTQTRDFTYIENAVNANIMAAECPKTGGEVINIACGEKISLNELVDELCLILGKSIKPDYANSRAGDVKDSLADISKARNLIGYEPVINVKEGLKRAVEYYR